MSNFNLLNPFLSARKDLLTVSAVLLTSRLWINPSALVSRAALLNAFCQFQRCFEAQFGVGENESASHPSQISIQTHDFTFWR